MLMKFILTLTRCSGRTALVALTLGALLLGSLQPQAGPQAPFRVKFHNALQLEVEFPFANVSSTGQGNALHLGRITTEALDETVNLLTGEGVARHELTAANGDKVLVDFHFLAIPDGPGLAVEGTWTIAGGTGRFAGATGAGTYKGAVEFTGPASALGGFVMVGTISTPGSVK